MTTRGITVLAGGLKETQEITRLAEAAGFDAAWSGEFLHRSGIVSAAAMAAVTTRIGVGTSIAYAVGRSPLVPASRIEELVPLLRRLWRLHEGPVRHQGRFYSVDITPTAEIEPPLRAGIPVYTAGVNPRMTEAAGRVADGLICHPTITGRYLEDVARPAIARGAAKAGRSPGDVRLMGIIICSIADDTATARREAAAQIAFYAAPKAYGPVMEAAGFGREAAAVRDAFRAGDHRAMIEAVSDAMLDEMAVAGTAAEVRDALPALEQRYDHAALYSPSFTLTPERVAENTRAIIETFAR